MNILSDEILEHIFCMVCITDLNTHCIRVSKRWNRILTQSVVFWKTYIRQHFDTSLNVNAEKDEPYLRNYATYFDPPPAVLKCRVATPPSWDVKNALECHPRPLAVALHVLTKIRSELDKRELIVDESSYSGHPTMCLFPWSGDVLPSAHRVFKMFNVDDIGYITSVSGISIQWQMDDDACGSIFGFHEVECIDSKGCEGVTMYSDSSEDDEDDSSDAELPRKGEMKENVSEPKKREFKSERERRIHLGLRPDDVEYVHIEPCESHQLTECDKCGDSFHVWVARIFRPSICVYGGEESHSGGYNYVFI